MNWIMYAIPGCLVLMSGTLTCIAAGCTISAARDRKRLFTKGERIGYVAVGTVLTLTLGTFTAAIAWTAWNICELTSVCR
jgi:hypothetical protein